MYWAKILSSIMGIILYVTSQNYRTDITSGKPKRLGASRRVFLSFRKVCRSQSTCSTNCVSHVTTSHGFTTPRAEDKLLLVAATGLRQLPVCADDVTTVGENVNAIKRKTGTLTRYRISSHSVSIRRQSSKITTVI